ncbi:hypothetical protein FRC00_008941 [Tulasnella sp. 408]|nr:hypothetical protein FRC00_008941 [Tulasnella sp. 408]
MSPNATGTVPLTWSSTLEEPADDPGEDLKLKLSYNGKKCFNQLHKYLKWLRTFINKNKWVNDVLVQEFIILWNLYTRGKDEYAKVTAVAEFFSRKAHSEVNKLFQMYTDLRGKLEDLASQRITLRQNQRADEAAIERLRGWSSEGTSNMNAGSPEAYVTNPFSDPQDDGPFSNPQHS